MSATPKPLVLIILDGFGHSENPEHNAIYAAQTPVYDRLRATYPHGLISGSGMDVGLPEMGKEQARYVSERSAEFIVTRNRDEVPDGYKLIQTQTFWSEEYDDTFRLYQRAN